MTELPTTFGKYYLTEKLATGGMAEIYLAKIIGPGGFEKPVVIKQIHPELSGNRHFVDLFVAEAKTLVTLAHGNIVPVYELGVVDEIYFIAMDYIDGPTLYRLTEVMAAREALMDPPVAAWITARILDGLDYAHRKGEGVIHRDLSPRNVMLSRDGEVKLVDFGIATTLGAPGEGAATQSAPTGSFPYMSPEQVRREALSVQTDLFSLGVLAWEMLAGRRLFARADADATLAAVLDDAVPRPSSVRPEVPARLDEVVMRALERDRAERWPSAGEMLAAINKYLYTLEEPPGPRDVAALVARFCPPETRRMPTHVEALGHESTSPPASGPATAVIPRVRTFATSADMKEVLDRATPLFPIEAVDAPQANDAPINAPIPRPPPKPLEMPGRRAPSRGALVLAGLGAIGLAGGAVYMFYEGRDRVLRGPHDAGAYAALADAEIDAPMQPLLTPDAIEPTDAVPPSPVDAAPSRRADGGARPSDAAAVDGATRGMATLQIGADPWGEIYIDGKPMGRTPKELSVTAGHHSVEIVFPAETPPRKQTFAVDLATGETKPLQADFK